MYSGRAVVRGRPLSPTFPSSPRPPFPRSPRHSVCFWLKQSVRILLEGATRLPSFGPRTWRDGNLPAMGKLPTLDVDLCLFHALAASGLATGNCLNRGRVACWRTARIQDCPTSHGPGLPLESSLMLATRRPIWVVHGRHRRQLLRRINQHQTARSTALPLLNMYAYVLFRNKRERATHARRDEEAAQVRPRARLRSHVRHGLPLRVPLRQGIFCRRAGSSWTRTSDQDIVCWTATSTQRTRHCLERMDAGDVSTGACAARLS